MVRDLPRGDRVVHGLVEAAPAEFLAALWECTAEWVRVLKPEGSIFVNLGDKYAGGGMGGHGDGIGAVCNGAARAQYRRPKIDAPAKSLLGLPWRYALGAIDQLGLILRAEIIWAKPNGLPESVTDRVRRSHEVVFHFTRQPRYYAAVDEIREPHDDKNKPGGPRGRDGVSLNPGSTSSTDGLRHRELRNAVREYNPLGKLPSSVWSIPSQPLTVPPGLGVDHFAAFPSELPRRIILGWSPPGVCTGCGQGRRPVVNVGETSWQRRRADGDPVRYGLAGVAALQRSLSDPADRAAGGLGVPATRTITGYACACPDTTAPTRPAIVLDPFGGTGTTALAASVLGRTGITIDRSRDYCRLAAWRTRDPGERCRVIGAPKPPPVAVGQEALWA